MSTIIIQGLKGPKLVTQGYASGSSSSGGGPLPPNTPVNLIPPAAGVGVNVGFISANHEDLRCHVRAAATGAFNIDVITATGATLNVPYVIKQIVSGAVTVDGDTALYTQAVDVDFEWPAVGKVIIWNPGVVDINWISDVRLYRGGR